MVFECRSISEYIQKPQTGIVFSNGGTTTPSFELKGQPLANPPESLRNNVQLARKDTAHIDTNNINYMNDSNYYEIKVNTSNILGKNSNSTLRYDEKTYKQECIAIHRNIWHIRGSKPQVSMLFIDSEGSLFHICIPIEIEDTNKNENQFLKYWIYRNPTGQMPAGMTINELLNFREEDNEKVKFLTLDYCLNINETNSRVRYTLCLFENALKVHRGDLPSWWTSDIELSTLTSRLPTETQALQSTSVINKKSYDEILNYILRGRFYKRGRTFDTKLVSDATYFATEGTQNAVLPANYTVTSRQIAGTMIKRPLQVSSGKRSLQNIKCYPIDLVNQVDNDGNIVIDEITNKPIDVNKVKEDTNISKGDINLVNPNAELDQKANEQRVLFWIVFIVVLTIFLAIMLAILVYFFKAKSYSPVMTGAVGTNTG